MCLATSEPASNENPRKIDVPALTNIFRHPIKAHGVEQISAASVTQGQGLPWDRVWAVAHEASKLNGTGWSRCVNFTRAAKAPKVHAITSTLDEASGTLTLSHPDRKDFTFQPDDDRQLTGFLAWVKPLVPADRAQSTHIIRASEQAMTDTDFPSISLNNQASRRALSHHVGTELSMERFRGNLWVDGLAPFEEHEWVGKTIAIGTAIFEGVDVIERCLATTVNTATGNRDADTLGTLEAQYGHRDFGLAMRVIESGDIKVGDEVSLV